MQTFTLEKSRYFPYIAWTLVISFTIFVGSLTLVVRSAIQEITAQAEHTLSGTTPVP